MSSYPGLNGTILTLPRPALRFRRGSLVLVLGASMLAAVVTGCAPMPPDQPRALLMGAPVLTGLAQVRDPQTGSDYFVPCNPCAAPTPKTRMLGSADVAPDATGKAVARPQPSVVAKLDAHTVAIPAEADAIPAGSAQLTDDVPPVTVVAASPATVAPVAVPASSSLRSLPFSSSVAILNDEAKRSLSELLPLAMKAERVFIRGRTDSTGTVAGNRALAIARAATVRAAFASGGVTPRKLKVSYCVTCFAASNDTEAGRSANRRVEVELVMPAPAVAVSK
jgi:outer membrane protein OmpA-like peptidoglycan-associated protein